MLYALDENELKQLRSADWTAEFPGARVLTAVFRTDQAVLARVLPRPLRAPEQPLGFAFVAHYPQTSFGTVYSEAALFVQAERECTVWPCRSMTIWQWQAGEKSSAIRRRWQSPSHWRRLVQQSLEASFAKGHSCSGLKSKQIDPVISRLSP